MVSSKESLMRDIYAAELGVLSVANTAAKVD